ncbi:unnamed protein product, partial [Vitis vinifera]|uniref:Uncharacterized protein n=1 Tax=Vitis vinifera TaxID=29760 RepID=D7U5C0_VITVI
MESLTNGEVLRLILIIQFLEPTMDSL